MPQNVLSNPKQSWRARTEGWYRYYAGYSPVFVEDALRLVETRNRSLHVLDPWVGVGTTCGVAADRGHATTGVDINPALVVITKARLLRSDVSESLDALCEQIIKGAIRKETEVAADEPLLNWFGPSSSAYLRAMERSIFRVLVTPSGNPSPLDFGLDHISPLAAFFYVALFRVTRSRLRAATSSNPTWIRASVPPQHRGKPAATTLHDAFRDAQKSLAKFLKIGVSRDDSSERPMEILQGSSTSLNIPDGSVDVVITSPPYCTRIDYVAGVRPELAVLGCNERSIKILRHMTLGNPTVPKTYRSGTDRLTPTAKLFLKEVKSHPSKASKGYYYRYFETYFDMLERSLAEMHRVVRPGGSTFLVVQDSYYKEVLLDLPKVASEMAEAKGWVHAQRFDFPVGRTMAVVNPRVRAYRQDFGAIESVLLLKRP